MKHKPNKSRSIFDAIFGGEDFLSNSLFSMNSFNFSFNEVEDGSDGFPSDNDENFHKTEEKIETGTHTITKEVWKSVDGTQRFERTSSQSKALPHSINKVSKEQLKIELQKAIDGQAFEKAAEIRDEIKKLENKE